MKGEGNEQDYGMRVYDPRLGRFLSVDPITMQYPELTPYQFASNRPIDGIDQDGLEWELSTEATRLKQRAQLEIDVVNAPARERKRIFSEAQQRAHGRATMDSATPQLYGYDQRTHEANRVAMLAGSGFKADGEKQAWRKLADNKTFKNFADNVALPMVEMAAFDKLLGLAYRGLKATSGLLQAFEDAGGHTIARHVGKTDAELIERLNSSNRISGASTFSDLATAEGVVGSTLKSNAAEITQ